jgi:hypothetical protein
MSNAIRRSARACVIVPGFREKRSTKDFVGTLNGVQFPALTAASRLWPPVVVSPNRYFEMIAVGTKRPPDGITRGVIRTPIGTGLRIMALALLIPACLSSEDSESEGSPAIEELPRVEGSQLSSPSAASAPDAGAGFEGETRVQEREWMVGFEDETRVQEREGMVGDTVRFRDREQGPVQLAVAAGLGLEEEYQFLRWVNPYYLRGDFDGDGLPDFAFWVRHRSTNRLAVAILPGTMDTVHLVGEVEPPVPATPLHSVATSLAGVVWNVRPVGWTIAHPRTTIPGLVVEGGPVQFETETIEVFPSLNSWALVWHAGRYHVVWVSD